MNTLGHYLLAPQLLWFLLLLPVVIILYLLKLRRTEAVVSSTMLWMKSLKDMTANAPFQRLRANLLLLLQLIILALAVGALARPYLRLEGISGRHMCIVVDHSASMQTIEADGKSRLEQAKAHALELIENLDRGDQAMVVAFAEKAEVRIEMSDDAQRLRAAVQGIEPTDTRSNIRDVMMIAASLSPDNPDLPATIPDLQLVLISDGKLTDLEEVGARARNVTYHQVGEESFNVGIAALRMREPETSDTQAQTLVSLVSSHDETVTTTLTLYLNDSAIGVEEVEIAAKSTEDVIFGHPVFSEGVIRVEIDIDDQLDVDNTAWIAVKPAHSVKTLLVSDGESSNGYYLKRALGLNPAVDLSEVTPAAYRATDDFELTLFDAYVPDTLPPGTSVYFNALPNVEGLMATGSMDQPPILGVDRSHPVMRYLNPGNVGISKAITFSTPPGSTELMTTTGSPLIADISRGGRQMLVVGFELSQTDWPLKLSFPLFVQNLVSWVPSQRTSVEQYLQAGTPIEVLPGVDTEEVRLTLPDGGSETLRMEASHPVYFGGTRTAGIYTVTRGEDSYVVAVNLTDAVESDITPANELAFGRGTVLASQKTINTTRELWPWFVLAALCVLQFEWWIYTRRAWI